MSEHAPCPHCGTKVEYVEDVVECPMCQGAIVWSILAGYLSEGGVTPSYRTRGYWSVRDDQCQRCQRSFPFGSLGHHYYAVAEKRIPVCGDCIPRLRKSNERIRRKRRRVGRSPATATTTLTG